MNESSPRIPVSVLTGFLGSGKTTLLNHLTRQSALKKTLVIINEFGEIGLDHNLVAHSQDDVVIEMSSGCLCCTIRGDLTRTLREAPGRFARGGKLWFDQVIIETTGLADPAPILHTLMTDAAILRRYRLDSVITTVDAVNGGDTLNRQIESIKQAAMADRLLLSKTDLCDGETLKDLQKRLRMLNPAAPQLVVDNGAIDPTLLFNASVYDPDTKSSEVRDWLKAEAYPELSDHDRHHDHNHGHDHGHDVNRHDEHIKSLCLTIDDPVTGEALEAWMEALQALGSSDFLRIKGIVNVRGQHGPVVIHGVQHTFHPPVVLSEWPSEDRRSRIVFITRDIDDSVLEGTLRELTERTRTGQEIVPGSPDGCASDRSPMPR